MKEVFLVCLSNCFSLILTSKSIQNILEGRLKSSYLINLKVNQINMSRLLTKVKVKNCQKYAILLIVEERMFYTHNDVSII